MDEKSKLFARNLSTLINYRGLSQRKLSEILGCNESTVSGWMHGTSHPTQKRLHKIAEALQVDVAYLIGSYNLFDENGLPNFEPDPVKQPTAAEVFGEPEDDVIQFPGQKATEENVSDFILKIAKLKDIIDKFDMLNAEQTKEVSSFIDFKIWEGENKHE
jgi:transcriptional regulator with XRE-family HTH domain